MTNTSAETSQDILKKDGFIECDRGYFQLVMSLLKKCKNGEISENREWLGSLLECAVQWGKLDVVRYLVTELKLDINYDCNNAGLGFGSALIAAVQFKSMVEDLINMGANVNQVTDATPLTEACALRRLTVVKQLLENGADVNITTSKGFSPLMAASSEEGDQAMEIMQCLLDRSANCNAQNNEGLTALHFAVLCESVQAATMLLQREVDMLPNMSGLTPILFAVYEESDKMFDLLQSSQFITRLEKANALEYKAAFLAPDDMEEVYKLLHQAMIIRFEKNREVLEKPVREPVAAFGNVCESRTLEELEARKGMNCVLLMECLAVLDRLFGRNSIGLIDKFVKIWKTLLNAGLYDRALSLAEYAIDGHSITEYDAESIVTDMAILASRTPYISDMQMLSTAERGLQCAIKMLQHFLQQTYRPDGWLDKMVLSCLILLNACIEYDVLDKPIAQIQAKSFMELFPLPAFEFCTSLHAATSFLLNRSCDFDIPMYKSLVQVLVKCGANVDEKDQAGNAIMAHVLQSSMLKSDRADIVEFLLQQGASPA